jgi:hypothetical protein
MRLRLWRRVGSRALLFLRRMLRRAKRLLSGTVHFRRLGYRFRCRSSRLRMFLRTRLRCQPGIKERTQAASRRLWYTLISYVISISNDYSDCRRFIIWKARDVEHAEARFALPGLPLCNWSCTGKNAQWQKFRRHVHVASFRPTVHAMSHDICLGLS